MTSFCTPRWRSIALLVLLIGFTSGCGGEQADRLAMKSAGEEKYQEVLDRSSGSGNDDQSFDNAISQDDGSTDNFGNFPPGRGVDVGVFGSTAEPNSEVAMSAEAPTFDSQFPAPKSHADSRAPVRSNSVTIDRIDLRTQSVPQHAHSTDVLPSENSSASSSDIAAVPSTPHFSNEKMAADLTEEAGEKIAELPVVESRDNQGMTEVSVFYGTDRQMEIVTKTSTMPLKVGVAVTIAFLTIAVGFLVFSRLKSSLAFAGLAGVLFLALGQYQHSSATRTGISYGPQRGTFVRGMATVTVPNSHRRGLVERPSILRLEFSEDEKKHVVLAQANELSGAEFYAQMQQKFSESDDRSLLVFVHGFNVNFDSAVRRTAQIATDLSFHGVPVCYSWPSHGSLAGYTIDENNVIWTVPHLRDFLVELATRSQAKSINIIAHSMGNRAVTASLVDIGLEIPAAKLPWFDQVVLAAPDVDADHFRNELAPRLADVASHVTLYASSDDQALVASKHLHGGYPRAGESGANLVVVPEIETIDVSGIDLSLLGHSYYGNSESILRDLYDVVRNRLPASQRTGLISQKMRDSTYWMLRQSRLSELHDIPIR